MTRIIPKPKRRAAVLTVVFAFLIGLFSRFEFLGLTNVQQNFILIGSFGILVLVFIFLIVKTNIWRLASPYSANQQDLDEREIAVQLKTYHKSYRILDLLFGLLMIFVYISSENLSTSYPKMGWMLLIATFLIIRLLPIMIIAWTEEDI